MGRIPDSDAADVNAAVAAAKAAFPAWSASAVAVRARILRRAADLIEERLEEVCNAPATLFD